MGRWTGRWMVGALSKAFATARTSGSLGPEDRSVLVAVNEEVSLELAVESSEEDTDEDPLTLFPERLVAF